MANPVAQAEALRGTLRQALTATNELIRALKGQQKQAKVVQSALASLKQLQSQAG